MVNDCSPCWRPDDVGAEYSRELADGDSALRPGHWSTGLADSVRPCSPSFSSSKNSSRVLNTVAVDYLWYILVKFLTNI